MHPHMLMLVRALHLRSHIFLPILCNTIHTPIACTYHTIVKIEKRNSETSYHLQFRSDSTSLHSTIDWGINQGRTLPTHTLYGRCCACMHLSQRCSVFILLHTRWFSSQKFRQVPLAKVSREGVVLHRAHSSRWSHCKDVCGKALKWLHCWSLHGGWDLYWHNSRHIIVAGKIHYTVFFFCTSGLL